MRNAAAIAAEVRQDCLSTLHRLGGINENFMGGVEMLMADAEQLRSLASMLGGLAATDGFQPTGIYWMLNRIADDVERATSVMRLASLKPGG